MKSQGKKKQMIKKKEVVKKQKVVKEKPRREFNKCYKFRIYPNKVQEKQLENILEKSRVTYNFLLNYMKFQGDVGGKLNRGRTQHLVTYIISKNKRLRDVGFKYLQYNNHKLFRQLKSLASNKRGGRKVGMMRPKFRDEFNSFPCYSGFNFNYEKGKFGLIRPSMDIGYIKIRVHRKIEGNIKHFIFIKDFDKWHMAISTDKEAPKKEKVIKFYKKDKIVGLDLGLKLFIYDSDKNSFKYNNYVKKNLDNLKSIQRKWSKSFEVNKKRRKKDKTIMKFSKKMDKLKILENKIYSKIVRKRKDFHHKTSNYYAEKYKFVIVEDLNIQGMLKDTKAKNVNKKASRGQNRNTLDAAWYSFVMLLDYKLKEKGGALIRINPRNTSKCCSKCGNIKEDLTLKDRVYICSKCGLEIDRDYNASLNILKLGKEKIKESYSSQELAKGRRVLKLSSKKTTR